MPRILEDLTYTVPQAAAAIHVSDDTVRTMVRRGDLPAMRIGRRILISKVVLAKWVEENANTKFAGTGPGHEAGAA
jgi:excisionase family DNA binding protein